MEKTTNRLDKIFLKTKKGVSHHFIFDSNIDQLSAGCIVTKQNKVLLTLSKISGKCGFPKGHSCSEDKFIYKTALRELKEETGIVLSREKLSRGHIRRNNTYYFVVSDNDINLDEEGKKDETEIEEIGWFTLEQIKEMPITHHLRSILVPELTIRKRKLKTQT